MPRKQKAEPEQIAELQVLMDEQVPGALKSAAADPRKKSATWIASGDFLVLLVCDATSASKPVQKRYTCKILDVQQK